MMENNPSCAERKVETLLNDSTRLSLPPPPQQHYRFIRIFHLHAAVKTTTAPRYLRPSVCSVFTRGKEGSYPLVALHPTSVPVCIAQCLVFFFSLTLLQCVGCKNMLCCNRLFVGNSSHCGLLLL